MLTNRKPFIPLLRIYEKQIKNSKMKTHIALSLLEAVALNAMALALVEDDMRHGFSVEEDIGY